MFLRIKKRLSLKNPIFYILLIAFNGKLFSQLGPGYMGKRVTANYGFNFSPAFFGANAQNESILGDGGGAESGSLAFNAIHEGSLEFSFSNRWSVGFSARYYKTAYDNATNFGYNNYNFAYRFADQRPSGYYNITGITYSLYFKHFGKRYVAPWGRYIMFGPVINTIRTEYDPTVMHAMAQVKNSSNNYELVVVTDFGPAQQDYKGFNLMFGMGRSRIIANRITLDYGFNTHAISALTVLFDFAGIGLTSSHDTDNYNYIEDTHGRRIRGVNRFNVFLKVGVLLF